MLIKLINKHTLIVDDFKFKCCIGKNGSKKTKKEGDKATPKGTFNINQLYYRIDRGRQTISKLKTKIIKKNMGWCDDPNNRFYNKEIKINSKIKCEKLFRKDYKYDLFLVIEYNTQKTKPFKGSAIFLHLTKDYKPTKGCIAIKRNDFDVLLRVLDKKNKIQIN